MPFRWVLAFGITCLAALIWSLLGSVEPLWVDELHTSWVISGGSDQLALRASAGNQSVWYFVVLDYFRSCLSTFGSSDSEGLLSEELALRLPSIIAWCLSTGLVMLVLLRASAHNLSRVLGFNSPGGWKSLCYHAPVAGWLLCILFDRLQWFYGVEARVYAIIQLLSLSGWLIVISFHSRKADPIVGGRKPWSVGNSSYCRFLAWTGFAVAQLELHITSLTSVITQLSVLCVLAISRPRMRIPLSASMLTLLAVGVSLLDDLQPIWRLRMQWQGMSGNAGWLQLLNLLPAGPMLVPLMAATVENLLSKRLSIHALRLTESTIWIWTVAFSLPLIVAWFLTRLEIAPLFHYRFVISTALPLTVVGGVWLTRIRAIWLRWAALSVSIGWLVASQGTISYWERGQLMGQNRNEDWKRAIDYVSEKFDSTRDSLWCSAGLIEGRTAVPPLKALENEYLSYPLRGMYQVKSNGIPVEPNALVGNSSYWAMQLGLSQVGNTAVNASSGPSQDSVASQVDSQRMDEGGVWIVCRGRSDVLRQRLLNAGLDQLPYRYPIAEFGRVSCVCLDQH